jgi:hypothetical protein
VAENPTITIVPITGEEFTKRVLRPLDEDKFEFLVRQGYDINMVLRLMARGIALDGEGGPTILFNAPSEGEGYREFRRRLLHLAGLDAERKLFVGPVLFGKVKPSGRIVRPIRMKSWPLWRRGFDGKAMPRVRCIR